MTALITWAGFVGSWLLVAGPLFQGSLELHRIELSSRRPGDRLPSRWWWLVPPVMYALVRRRIAGKERSNHERLFRASGTGWFAVGLGGALLAVGATWDVTTLLGLDVPGFWIVYVVMLVAAVLNTAIRMMHERTLTS